MPLWGRMWGRIKEEDAYNKAIRLFDAGQYEDAIQAFEAVLSSQNRSQLTRQLTQFYLGEAYCALANQQVSTSSDQAIANMKLALAIHPNYADWHFKLAALYAQRGERELAQASVERSLEINPRYRDAQRLQEGLAGGGDELAATLSELLAPRENELERYGKLALGHYKAGRFDDAVEACRQALALAPNYPDLHNRLGVVLYAAGKDNEAVQAFSRALEINDRYVETRLNRAIAYQRLGRTLDARCDFERVLELDPNNVVAREALS